jgi:hypothetical protein
MTSDLRLMAGQRGFYTGDQVQSTVATAFELYQRGVLFFQIRRHLGGMGDLASAEVLKMVDKSHFGGEATRRAILWIVRDAFGSSRPDFKVNPKAGAKSTLELFDLLMKAAPDAASREQIRHAMQPFRRDCSSVQEKIND